MYISVDLAHHEIFRAKVGKGGISKIIQRRGASHTRHLSYGMSGWIICRVVFTTMCQHQDICSSIVVSKLHSNEAILFFF